MTPIYIYFHICLINDWEEVVGRMLARIRSSGLYDKVNEIRCTVLGPLSVKTDILNDPKIAIVCRLEDMTSYERKCLLALHTHCCKEDCRVLYIHSKGVSKRKGDPGCVRDWVDCLMYFCVDLHEVMLKKLEVYDAVGPHLHTELPVLFGGNFWWSKSKHIRNLYANVKLRYGGPEMWIARAKRGMSFSFWSPWRPRINHYAFPYPPSEYVGKPFMNITVERK